MNISCILTKQSLHTIPFYNSKGVHLLTDTLPTFWAERIWILRFFTFWSFWDSKLPDFHAPRNLARAKRGPGWAGLGPGGPSGGPGGFFGGSCELICFLKDCLYAQAPEELEKVKCCTCGELKHVFEIKVVQSEDIVNGTVNQMRCKNCENLRKRIARLLRPATEMVEGYKELTATGRTFVPSIHVAYEHGNFVQVLMTVMTSHRYVGAIFTTDCRACVQDEIIFPIIKMPPARSQ